MHSKSGNMEVMINDKADEVTAELFRALLSRYQIGVETSMIGKFLFFIVFIYYFTNAIK